MYQRYAPRFTARGAPGGTVGHFYIATTNGVPSSFSTDNGPVWNVNILRNKAVFFQDKFQVRPKLTLNMKVLNRFGEASGGRAWEISEAAFGRNMDAVLDTIAAELRSQYSIGYYPNRPMKDGKWHSVRIRVKNPAYSARARKEYLDK